MSPAELVLRRRLTHPHCHTTIVGTLDIQHLRENMVAAEVGPLSGALYREVRARVAQAVPGSDTEYPWENTRRWRSLLLEQSRRRPGRCR